MADVVLGGESDRPKTQPVKRSTEATLQSIAKPLLAFGLVLVGVGVIDVALAWFPLRFGVGEWEFGTASRTFDSLALGTTGFVFISLSATIRGWALALRALAVVAAVVLLFLLAAYVLYALNIPIALGAVSGERHRIMQRAIVRTTAFAGMYTVLFGWLSWFTWRLGGAEKGVQ